MPPISGRNPLLREFTEIKLNSAPTRLFKFNFQKQGLSVRKWCLDPQGVGEFSTKWNGLWCILMVKCMGDFVLLGEWMGDGCKWVGTNGCVWVWICLSVSVDEYMSMDWLIVATLTPFGQTRPYSQRGQIKLYSHFPIFRLLNLTSWCQGLFKPWTPCGVTMKMEMVAMGMC